MSEPLVSVLTPAFKAERFLEAAVRSVLDQTFTNWELLIINDGSTDETGKIADSLAATDQRIRVIHRNGSSGRPAVPRNLALEQSKGRYIALLDADDLWHPQKLEKQIAFMQSAGARFSCTAYRRITEDGQLLSLIEVPLKATRGRILANNTVGCLTVMIEKDLLTQFGFDEEPSLKGREDYGLWLQILKQEKYVFGLNEELAQYRVVSGSISRNKKAMIVGQWRVYRKSAGLGVFRSLLCMVGWAWFGYLRNRDSL